MTITPVPKPHRLQVYSFPRSGTNYVMALLGKNFYPGDDLAVQGEWGHWSNRQPIDAPYGKLFGHHGAPWALKPGPAIYVYRDGRNALLSLHRSDGFHRVGIRKGSFEKWIAQPMDWKYSPANRSLEASCPVVEWYTHTRLWEPAMACGLVLPIRYEDAIERPEVTVLTVAEKFGLTPTPEFHPVDTLVGPSPHENHSHFNLSTMSDSALEYFDSIVPRGYWALGIETIHRHVGPIPPPS